MLGLIRRSPAQAKNKRQAPRRRRDVAVYVFSKDRLVGQAALLDDSELGVRLRSHAAGVLEAAQYILDPDHALVLQLTLAWRSGNEAGYQIVALTSLRGFVADPTVEHIRNLWNQIAVEHGVAAPRGVFGRAAPTSFGSAGRKS